MIQNEKILVESTLLPRVIVCLDVANGRVVKGVQFKGLKDQGDPVELALAYQYQGADELVFLDISASHEKRPTALNLVSQIARHLSIPFTVGGGLNRFDDVQAFLDAGADKVALNTGALLNPKLIDQTARGYGSQSVVVSIDVLAQEQQLKLTIQGGRKLVVRDFYLWAQEVADRGAGEILLNAMHKDGTGDGFDIALTQSLSQQLPIQVIASGGASSPQDFLRAFQAKIDACLAAGMFHSKRYRVDQVKAFLMANEIAVRQ